MKKRLLILLASVLTGVGAWAQTYTAETSSVVGDPSGRKITITLSGDWLNGANVEQETNNLINLVMGYDAETGFVKNNAYGQVIIKSIEGETITVNQALVRQLITGKAGVGTDFGNGFALEKNYVEYLDLSGVAVTEYVGHEGAASPNENATLFGRNGGVSPVKYFAMPAFAASVPEANRVIPSYTTAYLENLEELIIPVNTKKIAVAGFADGNFSKFKLNQGLEFIGNSAFYANSKRTGMETLDIPSSVKYIGPGAFNFRIYTDLYFHSAQAPICPVGKSVINGTEMPFVYSICYDGNGGQNTTEGDEYTKGYANRLNYKNGEYWFLMIHFPSSADVAPEILDVESYKDATRVYNKVYGTIYYDNTNDKGKVEIGVPGKEQEYIDREKVWGVSGSFDYVGQETEILSYEGKYTMLATGAEGVNIPADAYGKGAVNSGYQDTYRGLSYIWPSQSQYVRAYVTVCNGVKWDGVTKYRPTLTDEQIAYMVEDGLSFTLDGKDYVVGNSINYTEADANAYNATLPGAIHAGDVKATFTEEEAIEINGALSGAVAEGDNHSYTDTEAAAYNAALPGAVKKGDVKTPAQEAVEYDSYEEFITSKTNYAWMTQAEYEQALADAKAYPQDTWRNYIYKIAPSEAVYYTNEDEVKQYNQTLEGAVKPGDNVTFTAETAATYNATLEGAVKAGDPCEWYSADEANAINATLDGARDENYSVEKNYDDPSVADYLSMIAFQSTRRVVFADNGAGGDNYKINGMTGGYWWTICLPFDLTKKQIDKYFGGVDTKTGNVLPTHVCLFNKVDRKVDAEKGNTVKFYFTDDQYAKATSEDAVVLKAHVPYMIRPSKTDADAAVIIPASDFYSKAGSPMPTIVAANADDESATDHTVYRFVGNYNTAEPITNADGSVGTRTVTVPEYCYIYAKKAGATGKHPYKFWFVQNSGIAWGKNKCVIQVSKVGGGKEENDTFFGGSSNSAKTDPITVFEDSEIDESTTAVEKVIIIAGDGENSEVIYNLNGMQLNTKPNQGVYIQNGKKFMVK